MRYLTQFLQWLGISTVTCAPLCGLAQRKAIAQEVPAYRNPDFTVGQRIADLLGRMTLDEKVAQMEGIWRNRGNQKDVKQFFVDEKGAFLPDRAAMVLKNGLGQMSRPSEQRGPRAMAEFTNTMQKSLGLYLAASHRSQRHGKYSQG